MHGRRVEVRERDKTVRVYVEERVGAVEEVERFLDVELAVRVVIVARDLEQDRTRVLDSVVKVARRRRRHVEHEMRLVEG